MRLEKYRPSTNVEDRRCDFKVEKGKKGYKLYKHLCLDRPQPEQPVQSVDGLLLLSSLLLVGLIRRPSGARAGSPS